MAPHGERRRGAFRHMTAGAGRAEVAVAQPVGRASRSPLSQRGGGGFRPLPSLPSSRLPGPRGEGCRTCEKASGLAFRIDVQQSSTAAISLLTSARAGSLALSGSPDGPGPKAWYQRLSEFDPTGPAAKSSRASAANRAHLAGVLGYPGTRHGGDGPLHRGYGVAEAALRTLCHRTVDARGNHARQQDSSRSLIARRNWHVSGASRPPCRPKTWRQIVTETLPIRA